VKWKREEGTGDRPNEDPENENDDDVTKKREAKKRVYGGFAKIVGMVSLTEMRRGKEKVSCVRVENSLREGDD